MSWHPSRKPTWIAPVTVKEEDPVLAAKSLWQIQDQSGVCIMQLGWWSSPQKAHSALLKAREGL